MKRNAAEHHSQMLLYNMTQTTILDDSLMSLISLYSAVFKCQFLIESPGVFLSGVNNNNEHFGKKNALDFGMTSPQVQVKDEKIHHIEHLMIHVVLMFGRDELDGENHQLVYSMSRIIGGYIL